MAPIFNNNIPQLQKASGKHINQVVLAMVKGREVPSHLVNVSAGAGGYPQMSLKEGRTPERRLQSREKIRQFGEHDVSLMYKLNTELQGGRDYPVLTTALGVAAGVVSGGAGFIFTISTMGLSLAKQSARALARIGDEIWHVEEIGNSNGKPTYVSAYFLVDPYRSHTPTKGWLIHEERWNVTIQ